MNNTNIHSFQELSTYALDLHQERIKLSQVIRRLRHSKSQSPDTVNAIKLSKNLIKALDSIEQNPIEFFSDTEIRRMEIVSAQEEFVSFLQKHH